MLRIYVLNYNYGQYIRECVESLIGQTDQNFTVTCIDNGSSDGSKVFLRDVCAEHGWKFEEFPNLPVSNIGNHVAKTSEETFIVRLDADDTFCPHYVASIRNAITTTNPDIVYGDYYLMDYDSKVFLTQHILPRGKIGDSPIHDEPFHGACTVIRRKKLLDFGGYYKQFSRNDGFDLYLKFRKSALHHIAEPIFHYRRGHRSLSYNKSRIFNTRVEMIQTYCHEHNIIEGNETLHIFAFPNHPDFYRDWDLEAFRNFIKCWDRNVRMIVRDGIANDPSIIPWSAISAHAGLRLYLEKSVPLEGIRSFVVHSMNDQLAPLPFFEVAPLALELFESHSVISGVKLESSTYKTTAGGVTKVGASPRTFFETERMVLHAGGLTAFHRNSAENDVTTLLELSNDMLTDGHL